MKQFTSESLLEITNYLENYLKENTKVEFEVLNPDYSNTAYAGSIFDIENVSYVYRGYKAWIDLAQLLFSKMLTPKIASKNTIYLCFEKLDLNQSFHKSASSEEKYGLNSEFFNINKNEEPSFLLPYKKALENVKIKNRKQILDLGINTGDEFSLIKDILDKKIYKKMNFIGIDYCASAINFAKERFKEKNISFFQHDINTLDELKLKESDLIISIGTFQSPNIDFKKLFMSLIQNYLTKDGALILGFPNSRWMGGEMVYGAKVLNYEMSELSLLYKDVVYCKKYLQQKKFRVTITGKDYIFLTATKIGSL